VKNLTAAC